MDIFLEIGIILSLTLGVSLLMKFLKQPLIVGYILSGIIVGPYFLNILTGRSQLEIFSEIGIAILLFIVGLSLNPETIKYTGKASLVTGLGQIFFTSLIGFFILYFLGFDTVASLYGAVALTFSSTIIILKLLSDRGDLGRLYGKLSIGFLLVQDIVAAILLVLIPIIGAYSLSSGQIGSTFFDMFWQGLLLIFSLYIFSRFLLDKISRYVAQSQELLFLFSITWGLVLAGIFHYIGFSIEVGALIAGVTLSTSHYAFEIGSRLKPLRDFFIVMFFILLGSQLVLEGVGEMLIPAIILALFVLIGNPLIVFILMNLLGYRNRVGFMAGLTVAQISEFSLILIGLGYAQGHIDQDLVAIITLVGITTIAGSTYMVMNADKLYEIASPLLKKMQIRKHPVHNKECEKNVYETIIFGYGRIGQALVKTLQKTKTSFLVVEHDPELIALMKEKKINCVFGDGSDLEFLEEVGLDRVDKVVSTIPDFEINALITNFYRKNRNDGLVVMYGQSVEKTRELYKMGASYVVMPHHLGVHHLSAIFLASEDDTHLLEKARIKQLAELT